MPRMFEITSTAARVGTILRVAAILSYATGAAGAQGVERVSRQPSCERCTIEITRTITLGANSPEGLVDSPLWMACVDHGPFFASAVGTPGVIRVFDENGKFLRTFGKAGRDIGAFEVVFPIRVGLGDTLLLFDTKNSRLNFYSVAGVFQRALAIPQGVSAAVHLANGEVVVQAVLRTHDRIGLPLHLIDSQGRIARSFGSLSREVRPDVAFADSRRLAAAPNGMVWSAHLTEYAIELWDTTGVLKRRLEISTPWFKPWKTRPPNEPPKPILLDLRQDRSGLLWVMLAVPDSTFIPKPVIDGAPMEIDRSREYDTIVEVIDPVRLQVLASRRFDEYMRGFACDRVGFALRDERNGSASIEVWSMVFSQPKLRR